MGKYDRQLDSLPMLPREHSEYQDRVELAKAEFAEAKTATKLADAYVKVRREADKLDEQVKALNLRLEAVSQLLVDAFGREDLQLIKLGDGASVSVRPKPYPGVKDREAFRRWCLAQGMEHEMHLHFKTMEGLINQRLLNGDTEQCSGCQGKGNDDSTDSGLCADCGGTGAQTAPGIRVFVKQTPYLQNR